MKRFLLVLMLMCASCVQAQTTKPVFDATMFKNKPALLPGMKPIFICAPKETDEATARLAAREAIKRNALCVVDIEHLPVSLRLNTDCEVEVGHTALGRVVGWMKDECPSLAVGYYSLMPMREFYPSLKPVDSADYLQWQQVNDRFTFGRDHFGAATPVGLADKVHFLCPSLYTFSADVEAWKKYAKANIDEARRYGKPVYVFIWMRFHDSTGLKGQDLAPEFWKVQLEFLQQYADGIVIWGGYGVEWNEQAPWWLVTKEFLNGRK